MKKAVVLVLSLVFAYCANAQVRNIQGMSALGINGGLTGNGYYGGALFEHILLHRLDMKIEANVEFASYKEIKFNTENLFVGLNYTYLILGQSFFLKAGGGLVGGLNQIRDYKDLNSSLNSGLGYNVGGYLEGQVDIFPAGNFVIAPYFKQCYLALPSFGNWVFYTGLSFKYQF